MKSRYIKKHSEFVNELNRNTLYRAVRKLKDLGHNKKAEYILDNIPKYDEKFNISLVSTDYKNLDTNKLFSKNVKNRQYENDLGPTQYFDDDDDDNRRGFSHNSYLLENAKFHSSDYASDLYLFFTADNDTKIMRYKLRLSTIEHPEGKKVILSGVEHDTTKLAYKKDIKTLIKIVQQIYNNDQIGDNFKGALNRISEVSEEDDLTDLIPSLFEDRPRTFYTDENVNTLKSIKAIDKFKL